MRPGPTPPAAASSPITSPGRRMLDRLAGLFAGGMLVIGLLLLLAALIAPAVLSAAGLGPADGPGWARVAAHLLVGVAGEVVVRLRRSWASRVVVAADLAVIVAALAVIGWAWWP